VAVAADGALWVGTAKGLARRLPTGKWTRYTTESTGGGLRAMDVRDVRVDAEGAVWMATASGVSRRTAASDWSYIDITGARWLVPDPAGVVWVGAASGLYRVRVDALVVVP
jgi:ligand-binding sensor domain-containing protein